MRDLRFVAQHRGGPLTLEHHRQLITWAADCAEHVLPLAGDLSNDERLLEAIKIARAWSRGEVPVGAAQKASLGAHAVAREALTPTAIAVARAVGQAVATAHMADHSLGGALYALKAVGAADQSTELEGRWQLERLPVEIRELVAYTRYSIHPRSSYVATERPHFPVPRSVATLESIVLQSAFQSLLPAKLGVLEMGTLLHRRREVG